MLLRPLHAALWAIPLLSTCCLCDASSSSGSSSSWDGLPLSQLVSRADMLLQNQHIQQALEMYDAAVERDPSLYLNLYKRGTTYLAMRNTRKALADFNAVLALTEFDQARMQIARIHLREGSYTEATESVNTYISRNKKDSTAQDLKKSIGQASTSHKKAERAAEKKQWDVCVNSAGEALEQADASTGLLELRATCSSQLGRIEEAVGDLTRAVSISPSSPTILARLSLLNMLYLSETTSSSLTPLKQCLHFDPDSKTCKKLFRSLKKLDKDLIQARNFVEGDLFRKALNILDPKSSSEQDGLVKRITDLIAENSSNGNLLPDDSFSRLLTTVYGWTCKAYTGTASFRLAKPFCTKVLERDSENIDGMIGLGESLLKEEKYEEAVRYLNTAFDKTGRSDRKILESLQKAQRLLKVSKTKDYYRVLEVSRDADLNTIKKSYRRLVRLYHPDKPGGSEEKMAALNEAWEVLSNPELKARYDQGDDPNDPMSGHHHQQQQHQQFYQHQGGNPFGGFPGGNPFQQGGGGGSFFNDFFAGAGQQQGGPRVKFQWG